MASGITPPALLKGDVVAFLSPSARANGFFQEPLKRAQNYWVTRGYKVKVIFNASKCESFKEEVLQRCEEVHSAFRDPEIKAIICTVGGTTVNELLPYLDYAMIKANPKIFCGYSDITILHHAIFTQTGLRTFYGPNVATEFGVATEPFKFTIDHFFAVVQDSAGKPVGTVPRSQEWTEKLFDFEKGDISTWPKDQTRSVSWTWLRGGQATGRLMGGCISQLLRLAGTKYWPDYHGRIFLLESPMGAGMNDPYPLDTAQADLADLVNLGVLNVISGLVVGRPIGCDNEKREQLCKIILNQCHGTNFPILLDIDVGHTDPMLTIPLNAMARLDSAEDTFHILEPAVSS